MELVFLLQGVSSAVRIKKVINNNILCTVDEKGSELIVTGRGIGFQRHRGEILDPALIERTYRMEEKTEQKKLRELVEKIPIEHLNLTEELINYLALVGWNPGTDREFFTLQELVEAFDVSRINKAPGIFDMDKLTWFNAEYIRRMEPEKYLAMVTPWFDRALAGKGIDYKRLAELMQTRTEVFCRVPDMVRFLAELPDYDVALYTNKKSKTNPEVSRAALNLLRPVLAGIQDWTETAIHDALMEAIAQAGMKNAAALWPLRIAISGQQSTPGGAIEIAWLLGREETLRRLDDGLQRLENA